MICVDYNNAVHIALFAGNNPLDTSFSEWKTKMITMIMGYKSRFPGEKFCFCIDGWKTWRKAFYPEYKANRGPAREASAIDFKRFFEVKDKFTDSLKETFCCDKWVKVDSAEADDVIATIVTTTQGPHTIISTDRDFVQLLVDQSVKIWNPVKKDYRESMDPRKDLLVKIITGDPGDNIPQLLPKVGPKRALKLLENLEQSLADHNISEAFERNKKLIDFNQIPFSVVHEIKSVFTAAQTSKVDKKKFAQFLMNTDMSLLSRAEAWYAILEEQENA